MTPFRFPLRLISVVFSSVLMAAISFSPDLAWADQHSGKKGPKVSDSAFSEREIATFEREFKQRLDVESGAMAESGRLLMLKPVALTLRHLERADEIALAITSEEDPLEQAQLALDLKVTRLWLVNELLKLESADFNLFWALLHTRFVDPKVSQEFRKELRELVAAFSSSELFHPETDSLRIEFQSQLATDPRVDLFGKVVEHGAYAIGFLAFLRFGKTILPILKSLWQRKEIAKTFADILTKTKSITEGVEYASQNQWAALVGAMVGGMRASWDRIFNRKGNPDLWIHLADLDLLSRETKKLKRLHSKGKMEELRTEAKNPSSPPVQEYRAEIRRSLEIYDEVKSELVGEPDLESLHRELQFAMRFFRENGIAWEKPTSRNTSDRNLKNPGRPH